MSPMFVCDIRQKEKKKKNLSDPNSSAFSRPAHVECLIMQIIHKNLQAIIMDSEIIPPLKMMKLMTIILWIFLDDWWRE